MLHQVMINKFAFTLFVFKLFVLKLITLMKSTEIAYCQLSVLCNMIKSVERVLNLLVSLILRKKSHYCKTY